MAGGFDLLNFYVYKYFPPYQHIMTFSFYERKNNNFCFPFQINLHIKIL